VARGAFWRRRPGLHRPLALRATVPVGDAPSWEDDDTCLLANTRSDDVSFVSLAEARETARPPAGRGAKHITIGRVPADVLNAVAAN